MLRVAAWTAGALAVLLLAAALVIPPLLDTPRISAEIQQKVSAATGAAVSWQDMRLRLLPRPSAVLRGLSFKGEGVSAAADSVSVNLALLPLFRGHAEITAVSLQRPVVAVDLVPAASPSKPQPAAAPVDPVALHREIVDALRTYIPRAVISVEDGLVRVTRPGMPTLELSQLALNARSDARGLQLEAGASGRSWDKLALAARFGYDELSTDATLDASGVRPQEWLDWSFSASPLRVGVPNMEVKLRLRGAAGKPIELEAAVDGGNVDLARGAGVVRIPGVRLRANARAAAREISLHADELRIGVGRVTGADLRYGIDKSTLDGDIAYDLDIAQTLRHARTLFPEETKDALSRLGPMAGSVRGRVTLALGERSSVEVAAALATLDGALHAAAKIADFERGPRIQASLAESTLGPELLAWIWKAAELPDAFTLKAPVRLSVPRFAWAPDAPLELQASAAFPAGTRVAADLSWSNGALDLRRGSVSDKMSDAAVSLRMKGGALEGRYSGKLDSRSLAAVLQGAGRRSGALAGDVRFRYDESARRRATASGTLKGEKLDLSWLAGKPAMVETIEVSADGNTLSVAEATVDWAGQRATLRGTLSRSDSGPLVDAQIDSPGIVIDELLPPKKPEEEKKEKKSVDPWPLPVTGQITLRAGFIQSKQYRIAPVSGVLDLERERAHVDLKEGVLCGISLPFTLEATPRGFTAAARIRAAKQKMEDSIQCLSNEKVALSGPFDLVADLRTQGAPKDLKRNLQGTVKVDVRNGEVKKFALIGNILAMQNVAALVLQGGPKLGAEGFPFRQLSGNGHFDKGRFVLDEGVFYSNAIGFGANGWISLADYDSRLTVLVAPFALANEAVRKLPLLGYVVGGTLTSLPVAVSGDIRDPLVVPLGPGAITSELLGIFTRTITLPKKLEDSVK